MESRLLPWCSRPHRRHGGDSVDDNSIEFRVLPDLRLRASLAWSELIEAAQFSELVNPTCLASLTGALVCRHVAGEVIRFRMSDPGHAPTLIARPASYRELRRREALQQQFLQEARQSFENQDQSNAVRKCRQALAIRGGHRQECAEFTIESSLQVEKRRPLIFDWHSISSRRSSQEISNSWMLHPIVAAHL